MASKEAPVPVSKTYSSLVGGGEPMNAIEFRDLVRHPSFQRYKPKIIVGGAGAWQLERKDIMRSYGLDCVVIGESETIVTELFTKAAKGENIPTIVHCNPNIALEEIPTIKHASIYGCVEISRGCGRNCQFCTPTMQQRMTFSIDKIMKEVAVNVKEGNGRITLTTEDIFLYGAKDNGVIPNKEAVIALLKEVSSYPGVTAVPPAHMSPPPAVNTPSLIKEAAEILIERNWQGYRGKPIVTVGTGVETGSVRLMRKYMAGEQLPFWPGEWGELVPQAFGILNDNNWFPLATLILGLPEENEDD